MAAYYRPITLDLGLNRGRERIVRDRERIVYVWKFIEKMDFDLGKIIFEKASSTGGRQGRASEHIKLL